MRMIRKENGVTMTMLVITIIVLTIISSIVIQYSINGIDYSREKKQVAELESVQHAVYERYELYKTTGDESVLVHSTGVASSGDINAMRSNVRNSKTYKDNDKIKYIDFVPEEDVAVEQYYEIGKDELEELKLEGIKDKFIINYYTGECYNKTKAVTPKTNTVLYIY